MDTKWKKSKAVISVVSYVLSVSLLVFAVLFNPYTAFYTERGDLKQIASSDGRYELTEEFRDYVSGILNSLIHIGAGKTLPALYYSATAYDRGFGFSADFWRMGFGKRNTIVISEATAYEEDFSEVLNEATVVEETAELWNGATFGKQSEDVQVPESYGADSLGEEELGEKEIAEAREYFFQWHFEDKNLLYQVETVDSDGKPCVYSNAEGQKIGGDDNALPEQYGFLLKFDGDKARAWLDGEELELYGDGIYAWEDDQWAIPGYENYKISDDWQKSRVTIAVRRVPVRYTVDGQVYGNGLYWAYRDLGTRQQFFRMWLAGAACGIAMLAVSVFMRKTRRTAAGQIGKALGKVPVELALVLSLGAFYVMYMLFLFFIIWGDSATWMTLLGIVLIGVWMIHLIWLYFRHGNRPWRNSLLRKMVRLLSRREMKLEIQERMTARVFRPLYLLVAAAGSALAVYLADVTGLLDWSLISKLYGIPAAMLAAAVILLLYNTLRQWKLAADLGHLSDEIDAAYEGKERAAYELPADSDLADMAKKVAGIRDGLEEAVEERMKSERMKVELVANVSHDIKTPLTSIISYVDLLKEDETLPEELKDYVAILAQKSERLKEMVQDVFEVSKASSGQLPVQLQKLDLAKLLKQTMADMQEQIEAAPVSLRAQISEEPVEIVADGQRLYRVFQNLLQNALQYSLEGSRIYVKLEKKGSLAVASVRNTSKHELDDGIDFTERFVRGDESRTDGGSGLGLSIAKSFTEACGGTFTVKTIADLFVVTVEFAAEE